MQLTSTRCASSLCSQHCLQAFQQTGHMASLLQDQTTCRCAVPISGTDWREDDVRSRGTTSFSTSGAVKTQLLPLIRFTVTWVTFQINEWDMPRCDFPIRPAKCNELLGYDGNNVLIDISHKHSCTGTGCDEIIVLVSLTLILRLPVQCTKGFIL